MGQSAHAAPVDAEDPVAPLHTAFLVGDRVGQHPVDRDLLRLAVDAAGEGDPDAARWVLLVQEHDDDVVAACEEEEIGGLV